MAATTEQVVHVCHPRSVEAGEVNTGQVGAIKEHVFHILQINSLEARQIKTSKAGATIERLILDVLQAINSYQEVSFKTAPKSVILSNFLEKDGGIELSEGGFDEVSIQELGKKSLAADGLLETETLAIVLEKQGKYAQALAMYEKLMLNNPENSSTFAVRIAALKTLLSENNKENKNKK